MSNNDNYISITPFAHFADVVSNATMSKTTKTVKKSNRKNKRDDEKKDKPKKKAKLVPKVVHFTKVKAKNRVVSIIALIFRDPHLHFPTDTMRAVSHVQIGKGNGWVSSGLVQYLFCTVNLMNPLNGIPSPVLYLQECTR